MKKLSKKILITTLLFLFCLLMISSANATNVTLNPTDAGGINSAINTIGISSDVNNTITLNPGIYNKTTDRNNNINFNNKNLTIKGNGSTNNIIIDVQKSLRLFNITGNVNITFINITFINGTGYNDNNGGIIHKTGYGTLTIINCTLENTTGSLYQNYGGLLIYNREGDINLIDSQFINNNKSGYGFAIIYNDGGIFTISGCSFNNNIGNNSCIYNTGDNMTIIDSVFNGNTLPAGYTGLIGAIYNTGNNLIINNTNFYYNYATYGSTLINKGNNALINNSNFNNNSATADGGAIRNEGINMTINNCNFTNNSATTGGAICNINYMNINNCNFTNNSASQGGAINNNAFSANIVIKNSNFLNNSGNKTMGSGGAIINFGYMNINNCNFTNNSALFNGGAITNSGSDLIVTNSNFTNNKANTRHGGAIYNSGNLTINYSNFRKNTATEWGGAISNFKYMNITNCNFTDNIATEWGGAIYILGDKTNINNSIFIDNIATYGGAICSDGNNMAIYNSLFINNNATYDGGAIYNYGDNMAVMNSNFSNNIANDWGGAIYNEGTNTSSHNSKFINNSAAIGGVIFNYGNMLLSANIMENNTATSLGHEIYNNGSIGTLSLTYLDNSTIIVNNNTYIILYAILTDDRGNFVTGQNITIYVNGTFIDTLPVIEGKINITYLVNHGSGVIPVTGDYEGHPLHEIFINNGQLLIIENTTVTGNIDLNKDEYKINETAKITINVVNTGKDTAYEVKVKINLPPEFILNPTSIVVSKGYYDFNTNIWYIGDLNVDEEVTMNFTGKFTKTGTYTIDIITSGENFNTTTDNDTALVKQNTTPPIPPEPPTPENINKINNNPTAEAVMKETGIPINLILLMLLSVLAIFIGRKQN